MDYVLHYADEWLLDAVWARILPASKFPSLCDDAATGHVNATVRSMQQFATTCAAAGERVSALPRDNIIRQTLSLYVITYIGIVLMYFSIASMSYHFLFNKDLLKHPRFLKDQVKLEIKSSLNAFPMLDVLTVPWFVAEVRGYSRMYENWDEYGLAYLILSVPLFLVFTDTLIYWIHRSEHHPSVYKYIHKPHHKWIGALCVAACANSSAHTIRIACVPPARWVRTEPAVPHLPLHLPDAQAAVLGHVRLRESVEHHGTCTGAMHADLADPRLGHDLRLWAREVHQRAGTPHAPPPLLHLQLRAILHYVRPTRGQLP